MPFLGKRQSRRKSLNNQSYQDKQRRKKLRLCELPNDSRLCSKLWLATNYTLYPRSSFNFHSYFLSVSKFFVRFIRCLYTRSKIICGLLFINVIFFLSISDDFVTDHDGITASSLTYKNLTLPLKHLSYEELLTDMISSATITLVYFESLY